MGNKGLVWMIGCLLICIGGFLFSILTHNYIGIMVGLFSGILTVYPLADWTDKNNDRIRENSETCKGWTNWLM